MKFFILLTVVMEYLGFVLILLTVVLMLIGLEYSSLLLTIGALLLVVTNMVYYRCFNSRSTLYSMAFRLKDLVKE